MDNQFGDFRQPAFDGFVGAESRRFRYCDAGAAAANWQAPEFDDTAWEEVTYSFGPRLWKLGPVAPGTDTQNIEMELRKLKQVDPSVPVIINGKSLQWTPYSFSLRWGIEDDPTLNYAGAGPHGLRGTVPDDFIDLGRNDPGSIYFMWAAVNSSQEQNILFVMGSCSEYASWLNGNPVLSQNQTLPATRRLYGSLQYDTFARAKQPSIWQREPTRSCCDSSSRRASSCARTPFSILQKKRTARSVCAGSPIPAHRFSH